MDKAGVETALIGGMQPGFTFRMGPGYSSDRLFLNFSFKESLIYTEKYPDRFRCLYGIALTPENESSYMNMRK